MRPSSRPESRSLLCAEGALGEPILYLSLYFRTNRAAYHELLDHVRTLMGITGLNLAEEMHLAIFNLAPEIIVQILHGRAWRTFRNNSTQRVLVEAHFDTMSDALRSGAAIACLGAAREIGLLHVR